MAPDAPSGEADAGAGAPAPVSGSRACITAVAAGEREADLTAAPRHRPGYVSRMLTSHRSLAPRPRPRHPSPRRADHGAVPGPARRRSLPPSVRHDRLVDRLHAGHGRPRRAPVGRAAEGWHPARRCPRLRIDRGGSKLAAGHRARRSRWRPGARRAHTRSRHSRGTRSSTTPWAASRSWSRSARCATPRWCSSGRWTGWSMTSARPASCASATW